MGCDISKEKLDFYCDFTNESFTIQNNADGFDKFLSWMDQHGFKMEDIELAFEHTGHYGHSLIRFCEDHGIVYFQIAALEIKKSLGLVRGKNDCIDAKRICNYLKEKGYKLQAEKPLNKTVERLKLLKSQRALYVKQRASLLTAQKDLTETLSLKKDDLLIINNQQLIDALSQKLKALEKEIQTCIQEDKPIEKSYQLLISITGIGPVIALETILATNNFTTFKDWRKFASYVGCAPFSYSSGKYIGKSRISHFANKDIKAYLSSGAKSAIQFNPELKQYYQNKISQGKHKKCVTNVIRCKLIARMFSVVKRNKPFEKNYTHHLEVSIS